MNKSNGLTFSTNQLKPITKYIPTATAVVARAGIPCRGDIFPKTANPTPSRASANANRDAPTRQARAQPKAPTVAPMVMTSPTQVATYREPRSPSSEHELVNAATPASSVPKAIIATPVTKT